MKQYGQMKPPFEAGNETEAQPQMDTELVASGRMQVELERSAIDVQVATAQQYPRVLSKVLAEMDAAVTASAEIAEGCFYALKRRNKDGQEQIIEGPSVRLAEIVTSCWGNMRTGARVVEMGDKFVKTQGVAFDLQKNVATTTEVIRRITTKTGMRFNDDMLAVTANAAMSIAKRNAVMGVVPRVYVMNLMKKAQAVAAGNQMTLPAKRDGWLKWWASKNVPAHAVLGWLGVNGLEDIQTEHIRLLAGLKTSLEDGDTTIEKEFADFMDKPAPERPAGQERPAKAKPEAQASASDTAKTQEPAQPPTVSTTMANAAPSVPAKPWMPGEPVQTAKPAQKSATGQETASTPPPKSVWDLIADRLVHEGIAQDDFLRWAKAQKLLTEAQGVEDLPQAKARNIWSNWPAMMKQIAEFTAKNA